MPCHQTRVLLVLAALAMAAGVIAWPVAEVPLGVPDAEVSEAGAGAAGTAPLPAPPAARVRAERWLLGRCVDERGRAVPGVRIDVDGRAFGVGDADGRFALPLAEIELPCALRLAATAHVTMQAEFATGGLGEDLGTVCLPQGAALAGAVHDEHGQPLAGARVLLRMPQERAASLWHPCFRIGAETGADGAFAFADPLPAGAVSVGLDGLPLAGTGAVELVGGGRQWCELVATLGDPGQRIEGVVVDDAGLPLPGAVVQAFCGEDLGQSCGGVRADSRGAFRLRRPDGSPAAIWLAATGPAGVRGVCRGPLPWGARAVAVVAARGDRLLLEVVDRASREPIEEFAVQCVPSTGPGVTAAAARQLGGEHLGGRAWLDGVAAGGNVLIVWPADGRWLPNPPLVFDGTACGGVLRVELDRATPCPVQVVDAAGRPLAGVDVQLLDGQDVSPVRDLASLLATGGARGGVAVRFARGITGTDGRVRLPWRAVDDAPRELRLAGPSVPPQRVRGVRLGVEGTRVAVAAAGRVEMMLAGMAGAQVVARAVDATEAREPPTWSKPCLVGADGAAALALPVGRWQLHLVRPLTLGGKALAAVREEAPFAVVDVVGGRVVQVARDLGAAAMPAGLAGVARFDGEPILRVRLCCGEWTPAGTPRVCHVVDVRPDAGGGFGFAGLLPGEYSVRGVLGCDDHEVEVELMPFCTLAPGARIELPAVEFVSGRVALRVHDAGGAPASGWLTLRGPRGAALVGALDGGAFPCARLPAGVWQLRLRGEDGGRDLGDIEVPPAGVASVDLVVP